MYVKTLFSLLLFTWTLQYGSSLMQNETIFILGTVLSTYSFTCPPGQLVGLSANRMTLHFYDVVKRQLVMSKDLPLQGQLVQSSVDGTLHVVTHDSYVTIVENYELKTYPVAAIKASSVVILKDLVCITPTIENSAPFICFNTKNHSDHWHDCGGYQPEQGPAFVDTAKDWVYVNNQGLQKYKLSKDHYCLEAVTTSNSMNPFSTYGDYGGSQLWFSFDGSRIFLYDGMTLFASDDDNDMKPHGDFNASYEQYYYNYFSQSSSPPYNIAGIRTDINNTVHYYGWPYLMPLSSNSVRSIPLPSEARAVGAKQVHICNTDGTDITYVIAEYSYYTGTPETGVVTLN